jgi:UDP-GlcNAc:undecaprenyl-phosphate GlcNAc-1-phosphate transferase
MLLPHLAALTLGFAIAYGMMPLVMRLAREYQVLDLPDEGRRVHQTPVPRLGGVAIFVAAIISVSVVFAWDYFDSSFELPRQAGTLPGMIIGATIVFVTGIVDDVRGVRPALKLLAQSMAALAMVAYGFRIDAITVAGNSMIHLGLIAVPLTVFWIVGMINAFNLIDGVDGLAGTMAIIGLTACIGVDFLLHNASSLIVTFAMLGAVFAFMRYNQTPAKIFLGDSGSMLLGFFLSIRIVYASTGEDRVTYALIPLFALAYPLTDTFIAIVRRWLRGDPFSRADGRHIHHQILALGLSPQRTVELLGLFFFSVAFMGISIVFAPPRVTLAFGMGGAVLIFAAFFYGIKWLRYSEFMEFGSSVASVLLNARSHVRNKVMAGEIADRLLRAESIDQVSAMLGECAAEFKLLEVSIVPGARHFPGPESRRISPVHDRPFRVDYPIAWEHGGSVHEVVLRLWSDRPTDLRHVGAERIATKLGGALETWLQRNPAAFGPAPSLEEAAKRLSPRGVKRSD